jgi:hypothetical protein
MAAEGRVTVSERKSIMVVIGFSSPERKQSQPLRTGFAFCPPGNRGSFSHHPAVPPRTANAIPLPFVSQTGVAPRKSHIVNSRLGCL